jgi:Iap family predicted aminopeptidase
VKELKKYNITPHPQYPNYFQPFNFEYDSVKRSGKNIIALIDNGSKSTIALGAHYDHLGLGYDRNSRDANPKGKIHNGADDNASGVAAVLDLSRQIKGNEKKENYNYLIVFFSAEELGLIGSKYLVDHLPGGVSEVKAMINFDMIGRLDSENKLMISGIGTSTIWGNFFAKNGDKFSLKFDSSGTGASDHTSFYLKGIPVLHFFTGSHQDYHKPEDDWDKINYEGIKNITDYAYKLICEVDTLEEIAFIKTKSASNASSGKRKYKVTMGIMPDYTDTGDGLKIDGVTDGQAADKAGVKEGDKLVKIGDFAIKNIYDYMEALGKFEKGQEVTIKLIRNNLPLSLQLTF